MEFARLKDGHLIVYFFHYLAVNKLITDKTKLFLYNN